MGISHSKKRCAGINKANGFKGCGKETYYRTYGLCPSCLADWFGTETGKVFFEKLTLKAKSKTFDVKKAKRETTDWNKKLQTKINKIVRLIDYGQPCLAKNIFPKQMHAGHVFSRGSNPMLRFNLHNIHRQSAQSNHFQNEDGLFREGIVKEYGNTYFEFISDLRRVNDLKINTDTYIELYKKASTIALFMSKNEFKHTLKQRIELRNKINIDLGIYEKQFCEFKSN